MIEKKEIGKILPETNRLEELISKVTWISKRHLANEISEFSLTPPQFSVLRCLHEKHEAQTMSQLTQDCMAVMPTVTGIIDRLAVRGLVERQRDPADRRSLIINITPAGKQLIDKVTRHRREEVNKFLVTLSSEERISMIDLMQKYLDRMIESTDFAMEENEKE